MFWRFGCFDGHTNSPGVWHEVIIRAASFSSFGLLFEAHITRTYINAITMDPVKRSIEMAHRYAEFVQGSLRTEKLSSRYCNGCGCTGLSGGLRRHLESDRYRHISADKRSTKCVCGVSFWYETGYDKFTFYMHLFDCITAGKKARSKGMMAMEAEMELFRTKNTTTVFRTSGSPVSDIGKGADAESEVASSSSFVNKNKIVTNNDVTSSVVDRSNDNCPMEIASTSDSRGKNDVTTKFSDDEDEDEFFEEEETRKSVYVGDLMNRLTDRLPRNKLDFRGNDNARSNRRFAAYVRLDKKLLRYFTDPSSINYVRFEGDLCVRCSFCRESVPFTQRIMHGSKVHGTTGVVGGSNRNSVGLVCISCGLRFLFVGASSPFYPWYRYHIVCCALAKLFDRDIDPLHDNSLSTWLDKFDDKVKEFDCATVRQNANVYARFIAETTLPLGSKVRPIVDTYGDFQSKFLAPWYEQLRNTPNDDAADSDKLGMYLSVLRDLGRPGGMSLRSTVVDWDGEYAMPKNVIVRSFSVCGYKTIAYTCEPEIRQMLEEFRNERTVTRRVLAERFGRYDSFFEAAVSLRPAWLTTAIVCDPLEKKDGLHKLTYDPSIDDQIFDRSSCGLDMWLMHLSMFLNSATISGKDVTIVPSSSPVFVHMFLFSVAHDAIMAELFSNTDDYYVLPNTCLCVNPKMPKGCATSATDEEWEVDPRNCHRHVIVVFRNKACFGRFNVKFSVRNIMTSGTSDSRKKTVSQNEERTIEDLAYEHMVSVVNGGIPRKRKFIGDRAVVDDNVIESDDFSVGCRNDKDDKRVDGSFSSNHRGIRQKLKYSRRLYTRMHFRNTVNYVSRRKGSISFSDLFGEDEDCCENDENGQQRCKIGQSIMKQFYLDGSRVSRGRRTARFEDVDDSEERVKETGDDDSADKDEEFGLAEVKGSHGEESYHFCVSSPVCAHFRNLWHLVSRRGLDEVISYTRASDSLFLRFSSAMARDDGTVKLEEIADVLCGGREYVLRAHLLPLRMYTDRFEKLSNCSIDPTVLLRSFERLILYLGDKFLPEWFPSNLNMLRDVADDTDSPTRRSDCEYFLNESPLIAMDDFLHMRIRLPDRILVDMHRVNLFSGRLLDRYVDRANTFKKTLNMLAHYMQLDPSIDSLFRE